MVCKEELCAVFRNLQPHRRIDLMCGLLHLCLPLELRFLGSFMEDIGKKDFHFLREHEIKANSTCDVNALIENDDNTLRRKLAIYLSLLYSNHGSCSNALYKVLVSYLDRTVTNQQILIHNFDINSLQEMLTILTIACNHPSFTFEQKNSMHARYCFLEQQCHNLQKDIGAVLSNDTGSSSMGDNLADNLHHFHYQQQWNSCIDDVLTHPPQEAIYRDRPIMYPSMFEPSMSCDSPMSATTSRSSSPATNAPVYNVTHLLESLQLTCHLHVLSAFTIDKLRSLPDEDFERLQLPPCDIQKIRARLKLLPKDLRRPNTSVPPPGYIFPHRPPLMPHTRHHYPVMVLANPTPVTTVTHHDVRSSNDDSPNSDVEDRNTHSQSRMNKKNALKPDNKPPNDHKQEQIKFNQDSSANCVSLSLPPGYPIDTTYLLRPPFMAYGQPRPLYITRAPHHQIPYLCYPKPLSNITNMPHVASISNMQDISMLKSGIMVPHPSMQFIQPSAPQMFDSMNTNNMMGTNNDSQRISVNNNSDSAAISEKRHCDSPLSVASSSEFYNSGQSLNSPMSITSNTEASLNSLNSPVVILKNEVNNSKHRLNMLKNESLNDGKETRDQRTVDSSDLVKCDYLDMNNVAYNEFNNYSCDITQAINVNHKNLISHISRDDMNDNVRDHNSLDKHSTNQVENCEKLLDRSEKTEDAISNSGITSNLEMNKRAVNVVDLGPLTVMVNDTEDEIMNIHESISETIEKRGETSSDLITIECMTQHTSINNLIDSPDDLQLLDNSLEVENVIADEDIVVEFNIKANSSVKVTNRTTQVECVKKPAIPMSYSAVTRSNLPMSEISASNVMVDNRDSTKAELPISDQTFVGAIQKHTQPIEGKNNKYEPTYSENEWKIATNERKNPVFDQCKITRFDERKNSNFEECGNIKSEQWKTPHCEEQQNRNLTKEKRKNVRTRANSYSSEWKIVNLEVRKNTHSSESKKTNSDGLKNTKDVTKLMTAEERTLPSKQKVSARCDNMRNNICDKSKVVNIHRNESTNMNEQNHVDFNRVCLSNEQTYPEQKVTNFVSNQNFEERAESKRSTNHFDYNYCHEQKNTNHTERKSTKNSPVSYNKNRDGRIHGNGGKYRNRCDYYSYSDGRSFNNSKYTRSKDYYRTYSNTDSQTPINNHMDYSMNRSLVSTPLSPQISPQISPRIDMSQSAMTTNFPGPISPTESMLNGFTEHAHIPMTSANLAASKRPIMGQSLSQLTRIGLLPTTPTDRPPLVRSSNGVTPTSVNNLLTSIHNNVLHLSNNTSHSSMKTCYNCGTSSHSAEQCRQNSLSTVTGNYHLNFRPKQKSSK